MKRKTMLITGGVFAFAQIFYACNKGVDSQSKDASPSGLKGLTVNSRNLPSGTSLVIEKLTGDITTNESTAFLNYMNTVSAPATNDQNIWVFGSPAYQTEACG